MVSVGAEGRLRLLHALSTRELAGTERHVAELTQYLARRHDVTLLLEADTRDPVTGGDIADLLRDAAGLRVVKAGRGGYLGALAHLARRRYFDIVHTHLGRASARARLLKPLLQDTPLVATLHNAYVPRAYGGHDGLICIARWQTRALPPDRAYRVIHNWHAEPVSMLSRQEARTRLGLEDGCCVFGAAGRFVAEKGFESLLAAYAQARRDDPFLRASRLVLFGDGPERRRLQAHAGEGVVFEGFRPDLKEIMTGLDAFVLPSHHEPFGLVLLEAMAAGLPIMATDAGGVPEVVQGRNATLVPPRNVAAMAQGLSLLARTPRLAQDLRPFSVERAVGAVEDFYLEMIRARSRQSALGAYPPVAAKAKMGREKAEHAPKKRNPDQPAGQPNEGEGADRQYNATCCRA